MVYNNYALYLLLYNNCALYMLLYKQCRGFYYTAVVLKRVVNARSVFQEHHLVTLCLGVDQCGEIDH